jgi:SAM-dependent methyltransferase
MVTRIIDKKLLRRRLARAHARQVAGADFLLAPVVAELAERVAASDRHYELAVAHGGQGGALANALAGSGKVGSVFRIEQTMESPAGARGASAVADEESLPLGLGSIDLFVSSLALQWSNDLPGALIQIRRALRTDGLFLGALTGGNTLAELREALFAAETEIHGGAGPRVLPAADIRDLGALLQRAGFALPVADRDVLTIRYASAFDLFRDLKAMGATNALIERPRNFSGRRLFARAAEIYAERFSDPDGRIRATFEIVFLSGRASAR